MVLSLKMVQRKLHLKNNNIQKKLCHVLNIFGNKEARETLAHVRSQSHAVKASFIASSF